eukprot:Gb_39451 [translate_table: standard]
MKFSWMNLAWLGFFLTLGVVKETLGIRIFEGNLDNGTEKQHQYKVAVFALGSFWRGEAVFGCLPGVIRTTAGYSGGTKINPEYRILGDHAEAVQGIKGREPIFIKSSFGKICHGLDLSSGASARSIICVRKLYKGIVCTLDPVPEMGMHKKVEYDPKLIRYEQLLDVFWSNHDATQVFGQGPDVGLQYRSIIFTNSNDEAKLAAVSKEREQTKLMDNLVTTQIQQFEIFYPAESEHQV